MHYWQREKELDLLIFAKWSADVYNLWNALPARIDNKPLLIGGWEGKDKPIIKYDLVCFNGAGMISMNDENIPLHHETFFVPQMYHPFPGQKIEGDGTYICYCKTAKKPYDMLVTASLIRLKKHFPDIIIESDGDEEDWKEGLQLCTNLFGGALYPVTSEVSEKT